MNAREFGYFSKTGRTPVTEKKQRIRKTHAQVFQGSVPLTAPIPWALATHKLKEFKSQGLTNLKLRGY